MHAEFADFDAGLATPALSRIAVTGDDDWAPAGCGVAELWMFGNRLLPLGV